VLKNYLKKIIRALLGAYEIYYIYCWSSDTPEDTGSSGSLQHAVKRVDTADIEQSASALVLENQGFAGDGSHSYIYQGEDDVLGVCFYWHGNRYKARGFWPLAEGEAKLVQIETAPQARSRGVATELIRCSSQDMHRSGYTRLFARIWHSNTPSLRAFEKAGWTRTALVVQTFPLKRAKPLRFTWNVRV
jgi:RimJ/RimL family protein N-acetyltransferase